MIQIATNDMNVLFTSSGRRVSLVQMFKENLVTESIRGRVVTADVKRNAPTAYFSDRHHLVPQVTHDDYIDELLRICKNEEIRAIIPLIDTELPVLSSNKDLFASHDVTVLVPSTAVVAIGGDKLETFRFFAANDIPTPTVYDDNALPDRFPVIVKPRGGSSGVGVVTVRNPEELAFFRRYVHNSIVQELVTGDEFTVDVLADLQGNVGAIVPRQRLETRAGEVSKGLTRKDPEIIGAVADVVSKLAGVVGCINVQCFRKATGEISFIEMNPRFGGGAPLSIRAGANLPKWTIELLQGREFDGLDQSWQDGYGMLRYDEAVYTNGLLDEH